MFTLAVIVGAYLAYRLLMAAWALGDAWLNERDQS
jgi:hypothetical protein